jgi:hypothetical protein
MKCQACNKPIKHVYTWGEQTLGIECWKKIALPEIQKERIARRKQYERRSWEQAFALVEALKAKDFTKIRSDFKIQFLNGLIEQFEEKGFISDKQKQMVYGTGAWNGKYYDTGMLNNQDRFVEAVALYLIGDAVNRHIARDIATTTFTDKLKEQFETEIHLTAS